ncbi:MAG: deoxyribose-phosphate aldolase [Acutalibacteraceae bacterium]|nr:deoxyribose-phosphate aldolase [Acutalibacteraceae bacterium]
MDINEILSKVDHTVLSVSATKQDIISLCDDAKKYKTASVCIAPSFLKTAAEYLQGEIPVCTVIGFPNGYNTTETKCFETAGAIENGADEIDMVINIGDLKAKNYDKILNEINLVKKNCQGRILKVIIETCLLTEEEKIKMCDIVSQSDADFIKTSTGFSKSGATFSDIALFKKHIKNGKKIKVAGGISSIEDAEKFITLGADRLGTSRIVKIVKNETETGDY